MTPLKIGDKVRHNYTDGHGEGVVVDVRGDGSDRLAYMVMFDSCAGTFPYTYNREFQEIVPNVNITGTP